MDNGKGLRQKKLPDSVLKGDGESNPLGFVAATGVQPVFFAYWKQGLSSSAGAFQSRFTLFGTPLTDGSRTALIAENRPDSWQCWLATLPAAAEMLAARVCAAYHEPRRDQEEAADDRGANVVFDIGWVGSGRWHQPRHLRQAIITREPNDSAVYLVWTPVTGDSSTNAEAHSNLDEAQLGAQLHLLLHRPFDH